MTLGQKLTNLRKSRGMTQEELAEAVDVTRQTISKWELDTSTPDLDYLCRLCDLFGVTADYWIRPERETVESVPVQQTEPPPPSPHTAPLPPPTPPKPTAQTLSGLRFAGWGLFILGLIFTQIAILSILFGSGSATLWLLSGGFILIGLELLLIRWKPLFIVMWTLWLIWSFIQFVLIAHPTALFALNLSFIFLALWVFYTAFCLGATIGILIRYIRAKRAQR